MTKKLVAVLFGCLLMANHANAAGDFFFQSYVIFVEGQVTNVDVNGPSIDSGCGADDTKCECTHSGNVVYMGGTGTDGTATGLDFTCEWVVSFANGTNCTVSHSVNIPFAGDNSLTLGGDSQCAIVEAFGVPVIPESGHAFRVKSAYVAPR